MGKVPFFAHLLTDPQMTNNLCLTRKQEILSDPSEDGGRLLTISSALPQHVYDSYNAFRLCS